MSLRVGTISVKEVYQKQNIIKIAKLQVNPFLTEPIVLGNGLKEAERIIKSFFIDETESPEEIAPVNLQGMECRWKEIQSPNEHDKIICLVVNSREEKMQSQVFHEVLQTITNIFGSYEERHPISTEKLKLDLTLKKMRNEMQAKLGKRNLWYLIKNWFITILGSFYFAHFKKGKAYLKKVHELSYTTMVDGTFNSVMSGTTSEANQLIATLNQMEAEKKIIFGIHVTHSSIMSCYVQDRKTKHIHFIDGTEGGYTTAAIMLKEKLGV